MERGKASGPASGIVGLLLAVLPHVSWAAAAEKEHAPGIVNLDFTLLLQATISSSLQASSTSSSSSR